MNSWRRVYDFTQCSQCFTVSSRCSRAREWKIYLTSTLNTMREGNSVVLSSSKLRTIRRYCSFIAESCFCRNASHLSPPRTPLDNNRSKRTCLWVLALKQTSKCIPSALMMLRASWFNESRSYQVTPWFRTSFVAPCTGLNSFVHGSTGFFIKHSFRDYKKRSPYLTRRHAVGYEAESLSQV